uniref:Actinlike protein putative n=1 Tax=Albugo laibachii Nc14 TaxID=890382 RepID=F0W0X6_9STRA|nr:actinlike protein putative [Albugo laibachii Nc14]|eukprot:CCA14700.1 actinlike protein putative [Albugo laibachii Nc14]
MYCGEDVDAIVGDVGSECSKFGLAGEDTPPVVLPSVLGYHLNASDTQQNLSAYVIGDSISSPNSNSVWNLHRAIDSCVVKDWDAMEKIWNYAFKNLHVDPRNHPVLAATLAASSEIGPEGGQAEKMKNSEEYLELMFEKFDVPAFYLAQDAALDAFAFGRSCALVVEIGAGAARVVPVFDGYALHRPAQLYPSLGMTQISKYLEQVISTTHPDLKIRPRYCFQNVLDPKTGRLQAVPKSEEVSKNVPETYADYMKLELLRDIRETVCSVFPISNALERIQKHEHVLQKQEYELPDGTRLILGKECHLAPELFFSPSNQFPVHNDYETVEIKKEDTDLEEASIQTPCSTHAKSPQSLQAMVYDAVQKCDADLRREMLNSIILCGGGSLLPGLMERLHTELSGMISSSFKIRFLNMMKVERRFSTFIGGSILASLGSFQQLWVSSSEYQEMGASAICAKRFS